MTRPRLADLFSGAGGAAVGYERAGFEVVGFDLVAQPNYPFEHHRCNALGVDLYGFDAVHASPPCKRYTTAGNRARATATLFDPHPDLLAPTRALLAATGLPYLIENVPGAPLLAPVLLCGSSFGLDLRRHRLFESNRELAAPPCAHGWQTPRFTSLDYRRRTAGRLESVVGVHGNLQYAGERELRQAAMGIAWMTDRELTQAIPPAYTEHLGRQLIDQL